MAHIDDDRLEDWISAFERLPAERQENLRKWFATQRVIIEASGLEPEEWFRYVEWALDNPFDYSFIEDFPEAPSASSLDGAERTDSTRRPRELIGGATRVSLPEGEGLRGKAVAKKGLERELFDNFMKNRLGGK